MKIISQRNFVQEAENLLHAVQERTCECDQCFTIFAPESFDDFRAVLRGYPNHWLYMECPVCFRHYQLTADYMVTREIEKLQKRETGECKSET